MARTVLIDCEGLESEQKKKKSMLDHSKSMRFGAVHSCGADVFFLILLWVEKIVFETGLHMAIKLQLRTLRRIVVLRHRKVGRGPRGGRFTFRKSEHEARHSQFAHWLSRWPAGLVRDRSGPSSNDSTREVQQNQTSKGLIVLGKDASVGWFVSGYVRLLQSQYESKSARTVLKIISQNLADYFEYCNFTNFRCLKISVVSDQGAFGLV